MSAALALLIGVTAGLGTAAATLYWMPTIERWLDRYIAWLDRKNQKS